MMTGMEPGLTEAVIRILLGSVILLAGRNIFWAFVAIIGFLLGVEFARVWLADQGFLVALAAGLVLGVAGAVLAIVFERLAFALAGFFAGVFLVIFCAANLNFNTMPAAAPYIAGVIGAVLAVLLTDWAIIVLSALAGAALVVSSLALPPVAAAVIFPVLAAIGILVQRSLLARKYRAG